MTDPASTTAIIARPHGESWRGRYLHSYGGPGDLGPILHHRARAALPAEGGIDALIRTLIDEHTGWQRLHEDGERLGNCRCHDPEPASTSWFDREQLTPGQAARASYAYILGPAAMRIELNVGGDWRHLHTVRHTRPQGAPVFDLICARAHELLEIAAWDTDPLN